MGKSRTSSDVCLVVVVVVLKLEVDFSHGKLHTTCLTYISVYVHLKYITLIHFAAAYYKYSVLQIPFIFTTQLSNIFF